MKNEDIVITSAYRTPIGSFCGSLSSLSASELGSCVIKKCIKSSKLKVSEIDTVFMGQVLQAGAGQNPARQASIIAGIPKEKTATTEKFNKSSFLADGTRSFKILSGSPIITLKPSIR